MAAPKRFRQIAPYPKIDDDLQAKFRKLPPTPVSSDVIEKDNPPNEEKTLNQDHIYNLDDSGQ